MAHVHEGKRPVVVVCREPRVDLSREAAPPPVGGAAVSGKGQERVVEHGEHQPLLWSDRGGWQNRAAQWNDGGIAASGRLNST